MGPVSWGPALRSIVARVEASDVDELEVRADGLFVRLRREARGTEQASSAIAEQPSEISGLHLLRCPLTGIWYDAPSPGAPPFVAVGDSLDAGTVVGVIETMKVFNEVTSDVAGIVRHIFVARGELVNQQSPLLAIELSEDDTTIPPGQLT